MVLSAILLFVSPKSVPASTIEFLKKRSKKRSKRKTSLVCFLLRIIQTCSTPIYSNLHKQNIILPSFTLLCFRQHSISPYPSLSSYSHKFEPFQGLSLSSVELWLYKKGRKDVLFQTFVDHQWKFPFTKTFLLWKYSFSDE